ncbi:MAG: hypothetical protein Q8P92_04375 [Candidatus Daviesbacteria bacterium]|nr:hypothetical protein [Candidatus Daviesbacteria bacterium]
MSDLEKAIKEKDPGKLVEIILAGFQQLDEDLKEKRKLKKLSKANKKN